MSPLTLRCICLSSLMQQKSNKSTKHGRIHSWTDEIVTERRIPCPEKNKFNSLRHGGKPWPVLMSNTSLITWKEDTQSAISKNLYTLSERFIKSCPLNFIGAMNNWIVYNLPTNGGFETLAAELTLITTNSPPSVFDSSWKRGNGESDSWSFRLLEVDTGKLNYCAAELNVHVLTVRIHSKKTVGVNGSNPARTYLEWLTEIFLFLRQLLNFNTHWILIITILGICHV